MIYDVRTGGPKLYSHEDPEEVLSFRSEKTNFLQLSTKLLLIPIDTAPKGKSFNT